MLIPLLVLTWYCVTIAIAFWSEFKYDGMNYSYLILTPKHLSAIIFTILNWIAFFLFRSYYKYIFLITLLLGIVNIIVFTPTSFRAAIAINKLELWFQPAAVLAAFVAFVLSFKDIFPNHSQAESQISPYHQQKAEEEINAFRDTYKNKSSDFLIRIIEDKRYTAAATEAAQQILSERKENRQNN